MIKRRAIGVLKLIDGGEVDDKIVAVPTRKIDLTYDDIKSPERFAEDRAEASVGVFSRL